MNDTKNILTENDLNNQKNSNSSNLYSTKSNLDKVVSVDYDFIKDKMNTIQKRVNKSLDSCNENHNVVSQKDSNMLYSKMNNVVNMYRDIQDELMSNLYDESLLILGIGEVLSKNDAELAKKAGGL